MLLARAHTLSEQFAPADNPGGRRQRRNRALLQLELQWRKQSMEELNWQVLKSVWG